MINCHEQFLEEHYKFHFHLSANWSSFYILCYLCVGHPVMYVINIYQKGVFVKYSQQIYFLENRLELTFTCKDCADPLICC